MPSGSLRVSSSGGYSHALEFYDVVGVYPNSPSPSNTRAPPKVEVSGIEPLSELSVQFRDLVV